MTAYFHHNTIRKYTLGLLDTFNNLQVERTLSNGSKNYITVPITYGSKDKAFIFTQVDIDQFLTNNYNILPRMSLSLLTMEKDPTRDTNRLHTINKVLDDEVLTFQYNAVSYKFTYELSVATRSMTELTMLVEQIVPHFNPTYNLRIHEIDIQPEPTTVPVALFSIDYDIPTNIGQDDDIRICGATFILELRGNVYQPFTDLPKVEKLRMYLNNWEANTQIEDERRSVKYEYSVIDGVVGAGSVTHFIPEAVYAPVISEIQGVSSTGINTPIELELTFSDIDDETQFVYIWNIISGSGSVTQYISPFGYKATFIGTGIGTTTVQAQMIDRDGNISNFVTKNIEVV